MIEIQNLSNLGYSNLIKTSLQFRKGLKMSRKAFPFLAVGTKTHLPKASLNPYF